MYEPILSQYKTQLATAENKIADMGKLLNERDVEIALLKEQIYDITMQLKNTAMTTLTISQFLVLSCPKAQRYVQGIDNKFRALLGHFLFESLPDNAPKTSVDYVRSITQPDRTKSTIEVTHADQVNGVVEKGAEIIHTKKI
jgi:hypothetical protein